MAKSKEKIVVLYGSQTGNSEDVAERIGRQIRFLGLRANVVNLLEYHASKLINESLVVFVCSTTGNGEFPDTMMLFWKFLLRKDLPSTSLISLKFCVFGLGDSNYDKFNVVSKKLNKRLLHLGAVEFLPLTLADDQHELGYDAALDPWIHSFKEKLIEFYNIDIDLNNTTEKLLPPKYNIDFLESDSKRNTYCQENFINMNRNLPLAKLKTNKRITASDHFQAVHLLEFEIDPSIQYDPGDVAVICPENPETEVEDFLALLNVPLDIPFVLEPSEPDTPLPQCLPYPCTVRQCAISYFDILSIPRRSFFEFFRYFSKDELEEEKLMEFTTAEGQEELFTYCNRPRRNIIEVLQDFPNTTPFVPFQYLFDMIPCIRSRSFSIASSLKHNPNEFHLLVAVVEYKTRLQKPRRGLCSNWLAHLNPSLDVRIPFNIKHGSISMPQDNSPIIMVGPGTGCAPFRSFVLERSVLGISQNHLYFGCRYKDKDFLCEEDWLRLVKHNLLNIYVAFSRDQEEKVYVQHKIIESGKEVWNLIENKKAHIFVAGNAKQMPEAVRKAFLDVFESHMDADFATKYLAKLESSKRFQMETWA